MKICLESEGRRLQLVLPTRLIFSRRLLRFCLKMGKYTDVLVPDIPPEKLESICAEIMRVKRKYKRYELVDVVSADGDHVNITL